MNKEEKLLKLLQIAVENGYYPNEYCEDIMGLNSCSSFRICSFSNFCYVAYTRYNDNNLTSQEIEYSLNDLVTNFEEDRISFIEALCDNKTIKTNTNNLIFDNTGTLQVYLPVKNHAQIVQMQWVMNPTSKRLEWLFETFKHLLN